MSEMIGGALLQKAGGNIQVAGGGKVGLIGAFHKVDASGRKNADGKPSIQVRHFDRDRPCRLPARRTTGTGVGGSLLGSRSLASGLATCS